MPDGMTFRSEGVCLNIGNGNVAAPFGNAACDAQYPTVSLDVSDADELLDVMKKTREEICKTFGVPASLLANPYRASRTKAIPIDVTGKPTPPEIIKGAYGKTHFDVNNAPRGTRAFLDGNEVKYARESDTEGGWVRVMNHNANGEPIIVGEHIKETILFGEVTTLSPADLHEVDPRKASDLPWLQDSFVGEWTPIPTGNYRSMLECCVRAVAVLRGIMAPDAKMDLLYRRKDQADLSEIAVVAPIGRNENRRKAWAISEVSHQMLESNSSVLATILVNAMERLLTST